ncbi:MAG: hypothetical protein JWM03_1500 [Rhodocyclales bacterium]|nr:hypothetical protein [Rhodocyclales bacterium]
MSKRTLLWLAFAISAAVAYGLSFWHGFWPLGRIIAGWYVIFAIVMLLGALIVTLSRKAGPLERGDDLAEFFTLW